MTNAPVVGVDIGGSHITAACMDAAGQMREGTLARGHVNSAGEKQEIISDWCCIIREAIGQLPDTDQVKLGIAMPGPFDYEAGISWIKDNHKYNSLYSHNVKELLGAALDLPVEAILMKNDAGCFLQGEFQAGAARGFERAIGMTLGTGIGTARLAAGVADDAALWSMPFKTGKAEDYISTMWFQREYHLRTGQEKSVKEMAEACHQDQVARDLFEEFASNFGEFIVKFVSGFDPQAIIIGGNIMKSSNLFLPQTEELLRSRGILQPVKPAELGEHAAMIGAAALHRLSGVSDTGALV